MAGGNQSSVFEFLLWGLSEQQSSSTGSSWYSCGCTWSRWLGTSSSSWPLALTARLHTPMYFFLANLSCADILFASTTVPKALVNIQTQNRSHFLCRMPDSALLFLDIWGHGHISTGYNGLWHMWPSATLSTTPWSWAAGVVSSWLLPAGPLTSLVAMTHTFLIFRLSFCS